MTKKIIEAEEQLANETLVSKNNMETMVYKWLSFKNQQWEERINNQEYTSNILESNIPESKPDQFEAESSEDFAGDQSKTLGEYQKTNNRKQYQKNFTRIFKGRYKCNICDQTMKYQQMYAHMKRSHGDKPSCRICGKKFHPGSLKRHMDSQHIDKGPTDHVECLLCNEMLQPQALQGHNQEQHSLISMAEKKFLREGCPYCDKILHPKSMAYHTMSQHTFREQTKIQCSLCKRKFLPDSLKKHLLWMHTDEQNLQKMKAQCEYCGVYIKQQNLQGHLNSQHPEYKK